jgi:carboxypeptidase family protein
MSWLVVLLAWVNLALSQERWRLVHPDGSVEAVSGSRQGSDAQKAQILSAWVWSGRRAPRRVLPARIGRERFADDPDRLAVKVVRRSGARPPADLRLLAAPTLMWLEVPEASLPSWPVPADGRLALPLDPGRFWRLRVAGSGEGSWWVEVAPGKRAAVVVSQPAAGIDLLVLDAGGRPVEALRTSLQEATGRGGAARPWESLRTERGRLAAPGLPDEGEVSLTLLGSGEAPLVLRGRPSALPHEVRLAPGAELSGRLVDPGGAPVAGATVEAEFWAAGDLPQVLARQTRSDAKGAWRLRGLPAGKVAWTVRSRSFAPLAGTVDLQAGSRDDVGTRTLERGAELAVQVVDDTGAPLPRAQVQAGNLSATADARGVALLSGLPAAPVEIKGSAPRHLEGSARFNPPFPPAPRLPLARAFTLAGRFVDPSGAPVLRGSARLDAGSCRRDERLAAGGRFAIDLPPGGSAAELVLRSPETQELRLRIAPGAAGEVRDLGDLRAPEGLAVTGRVVRAEDGSPVPGVRIWTPRQGADGPAVAWAARDLLETLSGEDGGFRLSGLLPAPASLRVEAAGFARAQIELPLDPAATGTTGAVDLGKIPLSAGTTLRVRVDPRAREIQGAVARADLGNRWLEPDFLSAQVWDGEAVLPNVPAGRVTVSVLAGRRLVCEQAVVVQEGGEQEVDCRRPALSVSGWVLVGQTPAGTGTLSWQAPNLDVPGRIDTVVSPSGLRQTQVVGAGRPAVEVPVAADGHFQTDELLPGRWQVSWIIRGSITGSLAVEIPSVEHFETVLPFAGLALSGIVVDREGRPAAGARVRELASGALAFVAADGSFSLAGLRPGTARVQARREEETSSLAEVEIQAEHPPEPLRLVLGQHQMPTVPVQVTGGSGAPVVGAFVFFEEEGKGLRLVTAAAEGRTEVAVEAPLPPRVRAAAFAGGAWGFGSWTSFEAAQEGLVVPVAGAGALRVRSARRQGAPQILAKGGWDLSWMMRLLGAPPALTPDRPLEVTGLPAGQYRVALEGANLNLAVEDGKTAEARLDR